MVSTPIKVMLVLPSLMLMFAGPAAGDPAPPGFPAAAVEVKMLDGGKVRGNLLDLSADSVTLLIQGERRTLNLNRVRHVRTRPDSLKNGFLIGAAVLGGWCAYVCGQALPDGSDLASAIGINAMFGGLVGIGIDAMNPHRRFLYRNAGLAAGPTRGAGFTLSW